MLTIDSTFLWLTGISTIYNLFCDKRRFLWSRTLSSIDRSFYDNSASYDRQHFIRSKPLPRLYFLQHGFLRLTAVSKTYRLSTIYSWCAAECNRQAIQKVWRQREFMTEGSQQELIRMWQRRKEKKMSSNYKKEEWKRWKGCSKKEEERGKKRRSRRN